MNTKGKNTITKTANILAIIIGIFVLIVAISAVSSKAKGYSSIFGYTVYSVRTESMTGDNADSFNKGDLIFVNLLDEEERANLKVGDVITFFTLIDVDGDGTPERALNTHRIERINTIGDKEQIITKGDNNAEVDSTPIDKDSTDIVGIYSSKIPWIGNISLFVKSSTGFLILIVIPSLLVVIYCIYLFIKNYKVYNAEKRKEDIEKIKAKLEQEMKNKDKK